MSPGETKKINLRTTEKDEGKRLDVFIASNQELSLSRSQVKNLINQDRISIDHTIIKKPGLILKAKQTILIDVPEPQSLDLTPIDLSLKILFEDEHLAVLSKPAGMSVHPSTTETSPTLVHGLLHQLQSLSSVGGIARPGIVHRLDKGTSGVLVISKTDLAHQDLSHQFKVHSIDRRYIALAFGDLSRKGTSGKIETHFGRHPVHRKKMTGKLTQGRKAITHWKVLKTFSHFTLVECKLETGRTHQIRVHLSELGYSIVGDPIYGESESKLKKLNSSIKNKELREALSHLDHQFLHAAFLSFDHPITKKRLEFKEEPPEDLKKILLLLDYESKH